MSEQKLNHLSAAALLDEKRQHELHDYLRPMANDDDLVWQQMTFENFAKLLSGEGLYLRAYDEYSEFDEMRLADFIKSNSKGYSFTDSGKVHDEIERLYNTIERKLYISCWYNSPDLSDIVFRTYAKGNSGIAVGARVKDVCSLFDKAEKEEEEIDNIVCANVQYVPQNNLRNMELFELSQVYAPVFMKGLQFKMDNEFRICVEKNDPKRSYAERDAKQAKEHEYLDEISKIIDGVKSGDDAVARINEIEKEYNEIYKDYNPGHMQITANLKDFIEFIAIKENSLFQRLEPKGFTNFLWRCFNLNLEKDSEKNGFTVYKVIKEKDDKIV